VLLSLVGGDDQGFRAIASYLLMQEAKRLRPALLLLAGTFGRTLNEEGLVRAAAAVELLHVGTLYHDDVMDQAQMRRHVPSANQRWGNIMASASGTYVLARAVNELAACGSWANQLSSDAVMKLCTGQISELERAYDFKVDELEIMETLNGKTATLFELPLRLGSFLAGASEERVEALAAYGHALGLAFQLVDDALDFAGEQTSMGKRTGRDLRTGVYTLPVVLACRHSDVGRPLRDLLERFDPAEEDLEAAVALVRESGAIKQTLALARKKTREALTHLESLPDSAARLSLCRLAEYVVARSS
jgi:heptaprenyl diphosphate synthase